MLHSHFLFFLWVGSFTPSRLTSGGPPQCLNYGPGSEPGVNRGLGTVFWGYDSNLSYFRFLFSFCLGLFPFVRLKVTHCSGNIFLYVLLHREPLPLLAPRLLQI